MKNKHNKKSHKIKTEFSAHSLTNYSGILPIYNFMSKIGIFDMFDKISISLGFNIKYSTSSIFSIMILGIISGMNRISKIESFSRDPLVNKIFGIKKLDEDTIANRVKRFGMKQTSELLDIIGEISSKVHKTLKTFSDIMDLDSTALTVYGNQQGARKGYNPTKRGKKSYHPLMAFLDSTRECLLSWLRPGDSYTANNAPEFLKEALSKVPATIKKLLVRADRGFFDNKVLNELESHSNVKYLIKVKLKDLQKLMRSQTWEIIPGMSGYKMADFRYKCAGWKKERRFVAIRHIKKTDKKDRLFETNQYEYFCYVTNIYESPLYLHSLYGDRGTSENWIEAVKKQMFAGSLLTQEFWANEALWLASVLSYNITIWMRVLTDEKSWHEEPNTFRSWFVQLAGKLVESGRKVYLKMYEAYYYKERWRNIEKAIDSLCFA
jgi:hypothetical protein